MPVEIRPIRTDAEAERHAFISHYAFNGDRGDDAVARRSQYYPREWCVGAFDAGDLVAGVVIMPFEMYIHGAAIPLGGIASVSCLPERRRGGFVRGLLSDSLVRMRDAGQCLSALYTPHYSLYRRFGWEIAHRMIAYSFPPKVTRARLPAPAGAFRRVEAEEWRALDDIHRQHYAGRNGALVRDEQRWRLHVFSDYGKGHRDATIWSNVAGDEKGYVIYQSSHRPMPGRHFPETVLRVFDWVALDGEAYAAILGYLLGHDLSDQIVMLASQDEPLPDAFEEPVHIKEPPGAWFGAMLRLVDVQRAIEARPALPHGSGKAATIALTDVEAPWNAGTWRIQCSEGRIAAERTKTSADVEMDVGALAPIYNGFVRAADAARVGAVRVNNSGALQALADIFSVAYSPYCPDDF